MRDDKLKAIPNIKLQDFPFNYKDLGNLSSIESQSKPAEFELHKKIGNMEILQNENARIDTFYKNISRFEL